LTHWQRTEGVTAEGSIQPNHLPLEPNLVGGSNLHSCVAQELANSRGVGSELARMPIHADHNLLRSPYLKLSSGLKRSVKVQRKEVFRLQFEASLAQCSTDRPGVRLYLVAMPVHVDGERRPGPHQAQDEQRYHGSR
jgi:hypothetical protein